MQLENMSKEELIEKIKALNTIATDRMYMMAAYKSMLMENGLKVVNRWEAKGVERQHTYWGPEAKNLSGEDRARCILEAEDALPDSNQDVELIDGPAW